MLMPPVASGASGMFVPQAAPAQLPPARPSPIPDTGSIESVTPQQAAEVKLIADSLDEVDYFHVLQITQATPPALIKKAFYRESRIYHPDRFFHLADAELKQNLNSIYKRITEAYFVLRDDAKRKKYTVDVNGPDRANKLRFTEASESEVKAEAKKVQEDELSANPKARPLFKTAMQDYERQNWAAAERNFKMGLTYDPGNQKFKDKLAEVQKKLDEIRRTSGDAFKIK